MCQKVRIQFYKFKQEVEISEESEPESLEIESIEDTKEDDEDFNTLDKLIKA